MKLDALLRISLFAGCLPVGVFLPIAALVLGNEADPKYQIETWNYFVTWSNGVLPFIYLVTTPLGIIVSSRLLSLIDSPRLSKSSSNADDKMSDVRIRLVYFRTLMKVVPAGTVVFLTLMFGIAYTLRWPIIGSVGHSFFILRVCCVG